MRTAATLRTGARLLATLLLLLVTACVREGAAAPTGGDPAGPPPAEWLSGRGDNAGDGHPAGALLTAAEAPALHIAWSVELGSPIVAGPAITGGLVVVGTADGTLAAFSASEGAPAWRVTDLGPLTPSLTLFEGKAFVGSAAGHLYAFELQRGAQIWDWRAPGRSPELAGGALVHRGLLLVGVGGGSGGDSAAAGRLVALDPTSGNPVWEACLVATCAGGALVTGGLAVDAGGRGYAVTGAAGNGMLGFDAGTGRLEWRRRLGSAGGGVPGTPVRFRSGTRELVGAGGTDGAFTALDARTGAVVWERRLGDDGGFSGSPAADGRLLIVPAAGPSPGVLALSPEDGRTTWTAATAEPVHGSPAVGVGVVVVGTGMETGPGGLTAFDTASGLPLWSWAAADVMVAGPAIAGHTIYAGGHAGRLLAFRP